jgi:hypothetical protein
VDPRTGVDRWENLAPTGFRSTDSPARSELLSQPTYGFVYLCLLNFSVCKAKNIDSGLVRKRGMNKHYVQERSRPNLCYHSKNYVDRLRRILCK